ncbi:MAG: zinc-binding alcohol dehydrogenase [Ornithinimicrobium sp.]
MSAPQPQDSTVPRAPSVGGMQASSFWSSGAGSGEVRTHVVARPGPGEVLVRALHSGISRGSESLVYTGQVPPSVSTAMRAPFQEGDLPGPVKYGYLSVGEVIELGSTGSHLRLGQRVFALFPHQDRYVIPVEAATIVPDDVPSRRAVLAGVVETAINVVWDATPRWGERIAVLGCGLVGASVCALLRDFPLARLVVVDPQPRSVALAARLGIESLTPEQVTAEFDTVVHCSGTQDGLALGLSLLAFEGQLVETSWFGQHSPVVPLGAEFHSRRLTIRASQVSTVAPSMRERRTRRDRMAAALAELRDPFYDSLLTGSTTLADLPETMAGIASGHMPGWCQVVDYPTATRNDTRV